MISYLVIRPSVPVYSIRCCSWEMRPFTRSKLRLHNAELGGCAAHSEVRGPEAPSGEQRGGQQVKIDPSRTCAPKFVRVQEVVDFGFGSGRCLRKLAQQEQRAGAVLLRPASKFPD